MKKFFILIVMCAVVWGMTSGKEGAELTDKDKRIDYIELPVLDITEAKHFYGEVFGWTFVDWGPDYTSFNDGRLDGGFRKETSVQRGGVLIIMYAIDLNAIKEKIKTSGGTIVQDTFEFPGGRRFHFTDPSRNELAVWSDK